MGMLKNLLLLAAEGSEKSLPEFYLFGSRLGEAFFFLVAGVVLGILGQLILDRARRLNEDHEIWFDFTTRSLKTDLATKVGADVAYSVKGTKIADPYVIDFYIWSTGTKDIKPSEFVENKDVEVGLGVKVVSELTGSLEHDIDQALLSWETDGTIRLKPSLVRKQMAKRYRLLTDGDVERLVVSDPVADLNLYSLHHNLGEDSKVKKFARGLTWALWIFAAFSFVAIVVVAALLPTAAVEDKIWLALIPPAFFVLGASTWIYGLTPTRRSSRAKKTLYRRLGLRVEKPTIDFVEPDGFS